ncbi:MAG: 16S rRNA (uracil(1498)-N(3))-methyltransferase [Flavobacteriales bacterium]
MHLFYSTTIQNNQILLDEEESRHAISVLRLKVDDNFQVTDGRGSLYRCKVGEITKKNVVGQILETEKTSVAQSLLHIAIAPTKNTDRLEWFLEKSCEFGIGKITPIICERSERKDVRIDRLNKVLVAAMKQSLHLWLPDLREPLPLKKLLAESGSVEKYIAHCVPGNKQQFFDAVSPTQPTLILIGPEGDFSPNEIQLAIEQKFKPVSLGNSRLRTETAGIAAAHIFAIRSEKK